MCISISCFLFYCIFYSSGAFLLKDRPLRINDFSGGPSQLSSANMPVKVETQDFWIQVTFVLGPNPRGGSKLVGIMEICAIVGNTGSLLRVWGKCVGGGPVRCMVPRVDGCRHCGTGLGWCRSRSSSGVPVTARLRQPPAGQQPSYLTTLHRHGGLTWRGRGRLPYCEKEQLVIV